jgi:hypothetical protein
MTTMRLSLVELFLLLLFPLFFLLLVPSACCSFCETGSESEITRYDGIPLYPFGRGGTMEMFGISSWASLGVTRKTKMYRSMTLLIVTALNLICASSIQGLPNSFALWLPPGLCTCAPPPQHTQAAF